MNQDDLRERTKEFAHRCVKLSTALPQNCLGDHIKKQLIRCSTSAASNYRAACLAQSRADFVAKLSIAVEEVDEAFFWIEFVVDEELMNEARTEPLLHEARELIAILVASRKTAKDRTAEVTAGIRRGPNYR